MQSSRSTGSRFGARGSGLDASFLVIRAGVEQPFLWRQIAFSEDATGCAAAMIEALAIGLNTAILLSIRAAAIDIAPNAAKWCNRHHVAGGTDATRVTRVLTATATSGKPGITLLAELDATTHWPVTPEAGQHDGQSAQPAPALGTLVGATGTGIIDAGSTIAIIAVHVIIPGTMIEQRLGTTQTRGIINNRLGAA